MHDPISIFLVFFGVISITVVLFVFWIIAAVLRLVGRGVSTLFRISNPPQPAFPPTFRCTRRGCQAINPSSARFCRRCGRELGQGQGHGPGQGEVRRRAAMW